MFIFEFYLETELVSENYLYKPRAGVGKNGGVYSYLYKDPLIVKYQEKIQEAVRAQVYLDCLPPLENVVGVVMFYMFGVHPNRYYQRDLTNMIKATEDAIFSVLPYDDSLVTCDIKRKVPSETDFMYIRLGVRTSEEIEDIADAMELATSWEGDRGQYY